MGTLTSLSLAASIFLTIGFIAYKLLLAHSKQPTLNRAVILTLFISSFFAAPLATMFPDWEREARHTASATNVGTAVIDIIPTPVQKTPVWVKAAVCLYIGGVAVTLLLTIVAAVRIVMIVRNGRRTKMDGYTLVTVSDSDIIPCSWGRYMIVSDADLDTSADMIALHERAHIDRGHWIDLVIARLACILQWYNPAAYLLQHELRMIHEYEADEAVLKSGADEMAYQLLLIGHATAVRQFPLINNLNTSNLKKRIIMMKKPVSGLRRRISALAMIPAAILALTVIHTDAIASVLDSTSHSSASVTETPKTAQMKRKTDATVSKATIEHVETIAEFPGGMHVMMEWLAENLRYPQSMIDGNIEGLVVVQFKVRTDGSISDIEIKRSICPDADAEAKRIVASMPRWTPAMKDGKTIETSYTLPVNFRLSAPKSQKMSVGADGKYITLDRGELKTNFTPNSPGSPVIFVDGKRFEGNLESDIDPNNIQSMTIRNDDPKYPDKVIYITLKK